jgi:hypothetical protein
VRNAKKLLLKEMIVKEKVYKKVPPPGALKQKSPPKQERGTFFVSHKAELS